MDEDMEEVEIVFAQRLASGEPIARQRAIKHLQIHIRERALAEKGFSSDSLTRLCKGLHYALWMQDKMILQEEIAEEICALVGLFRTEEQLLEFVEAMLMTLSKEWPNIDRWRMDKFLMFIRRLIRTLFLRLAFRGWEPPLCAQYLQFFRLSLLSAHSIFCESLKFHCASIWLDELDNATTATSPKDTAAINGGENSRNNPMDGQRSLEFVRPYVQLLQEPISDTFFRSICSEIFDTILCDFEQRKVENLEVVGEEEGDNGEGKEAKETDGTSPTLEFDYKRIGQLLFEAGKQQGVPSRRRKRIYALCKKFECAAKGIDPFPVPDLEGIKLQKKKRRRFTNRN
uniref:Ribosomal RNA processing 1 n=1 Tax=Globodera rostochiensis TaxID=31243 RepID=A0A914GTJ1_GLORO